MNALRNKVQLIGRLGQDPKFITFDEGKSKVNFSVATNESYRDSEGDKVERTQWHDIVAWGHLSEIMCQYLKKGSEVAIEGRLNYRTYDDKEGNTRYVTEIVAKDLLMLDKKPSEE
jgi:single-strand DNA-binding protein